MRASLLPPHLTANEVTQYMEMNKAEKKMNHCQKSYELLYYCLLNIICVEKYA